MNQLLRLKLSLIILLSLVGCKNGSYSSRFSEGECVLEEVNHYASYVKQNGPIYKIESQKDDSFTVSVWYNHSWYYQGKKPLTYFKDRKKLVYKGMNCPDGRSNASITDKIKGIDL